MSCTLCILAAGLGSRFKGGIKQLEPFGPNGEIIMDYSIYDAVEAGFDKVVFIIRKDIREAFDKMIGDRISKYVKIDYVYQELDCLPEGYSVPEGRVKPWGHGHAVCCCKGVINEPFAVINADDFYGKEAFVKLHDFLCNENSDRKKLHLGMAGFDVKDVTMTDLISGRETLEDVNMIVYCGGFSNSDVLGSAKGWAGAFLFNPKAKEALDKYYAREDTLSLGVCNGCQLMMELNLINPEHKKNGKMLHNDSHKFESRFLGVTVPTNRSVMLGSLSGSKLGIWVAHGEGKFSLPYDEDKYNVVLKYSYDEYPSNPNGSDYSIAGLASADGRHLAMMPHLERAIFPWQNGCYPADRVNSDQITPWVEAFVNARKWVEANKK